MKILMINSVCGIRSTGRICTDIAETLEKEGHECKIAYGREEVPEKYQRFAFKIGSAFGVKMHAGLSRIFDGSGFYSKSATRRFVKWMKKYDPDIIHLHNLHGYYINIPLLFKSLKRMGKPIVWTLHDCWAFTGHCSYFDFVKCDKWQTRCTRCPQKKNYPTSKLFDNSAKNFRRKQNCFSGLENLTIVTPSEWLAGLVKLSYLKDNEVKVINNGIDLSIFKPTESDFKEKNGLTNQKIVLGVASVWDKRKGIDDFIKLNELISESHKVVLVGVTEDQKRKLPQEVLAITRTNNVKELAEIYSIADVFFNPTYEDNYPTVNLEAQACGTPVITYQTGGSVESVPSNNVVPQGDIKAVHDLIVTEKYKQAERIFSLEDMVDGYLKLYNKIIEIGQGE